MTNYNEKLHQMVDGIKQVTTQGRTVKHMNKLGGRLTSKMMR